MDNDVPPIHPHSNPPPIYVTAPQPRRSGRGWMILSLVLLAIVGFMVLSNIASFVLSAKESTGVESGRHFEEITVQNPGANEKIAIVDVEGMITSLRYRGGRSMVDSISDQLKVAAKDPAVKAVILNVDSPGGEVLASDDISRAILDFQNDYNKPVIAAMGGLAASGGYYIAAPCQWIVANELTLTGSIGVILSSFNYRGLMDKVGLRPHVFKSGKYKDMLRGSRLPEEIQPEEEQMIQDMIMETYGKFKSVVKEGRARAAKLNNGKGKTLSPDWEQYADGRILTGKNAYELGFVDQLGNFNTAVETTVKIAGITGKPRLVRYQEPFSLAQVFGFMGEQEDKTIKIDLGVDLPKLQTGRPYFLSPTVVH